MCKCLYCILTYIPSDLCTGVMLLDHMVVIFLLFWGPSILLSVVVSLPYIPTNSAWGFFFFLHLHQHLLLFVFLLIVILTGLRWDIDVILIYISLMPSNYFLNRTSIPHQLRERIDKWDCIKLKPVQQK
jgi:hypothetical protein